MVDKFQSNGYGSYPTHQSAHGGSSLPVNSHQYPSEAAPLLPGNTERKEISMFGCFLAFILFSWLYHTYMGLTRYPLDLSAGRRREEQERQSLHLFWDHVEAHTCSTYATREYTAQLMNLPTSLVYRVDACMATPLEIHGISHLPKTCDDRGPGVVIGRWDSNQQEPDCTTYWDEYNDKGCTSPGSGKRHFTHKLENLPRGSDWREFCATTPIRFNNMHFPGAEECFTSIWGVYGRWEVDDSNC